MEQYRRKRIRRRKKTRNRVFFRLFILVLILITFFAGYKITKKIKNKVEKEPQTQTIDEEKPSEVISTTNNEPVKYIYHSNQDYMNLSLEERQNRESVINLINERAKRDKNYVFIQNNLSKMPDSLIRLLLSQNEAMDFVIGNIENNNNLGIESNEFDITSSLPFYLQWDKRWGYNDYANSKIGLTGCAPTSVAMVLSKLKGDEILPSTIAVFSSEKGHDSSGSTAWALMDDIAEEYSVNVKTLQIDPKVMKESLLNGGYLIISLKPGKYTTTGHMIAISGIDENDKFIVNDPNSVQNSVRSWIYEDFSKDINNIWSFENK